jgi:transcriptional regulator of acetoin/glycerol metabolism
LPDLPDSHVLEPRASVKAVRLGPKGADATLLAALHQAQWNVSAVARDLAVSRMTLYRRMKRSGIVAPHRQGG